jgi:hypothetical protein
MSWISRRRILGATALGIVSTSAHHIWAGEAGNNSQTDTTEKQTEARPLALENYQPRSMLHLPETHVARARYPIIDFHTHVTGSAKVVKGVSLGAERRITGQPQELLPVMERKNLLALVNLTDGFGPGLQGAIAQYDSRWGLGTDIQLRVPATAAYRTAREIRGGPGLFYCTLNQFTAMTTGTALTGAWL